LVEVTEAPIIPEKAIGLVRRDEYGGVISYVGTVRDSSEGKRVVYLEHQEPWSVIARRELERIAGEIRVRWGLNDVAMIHRIGRALPGEVLLVVAIGAPHRQEAFEACQYAIDRFKEASAPWVVECTAEA